MLISQDSLTHKFNLLHGRGPLRGDFIKPYAGIEFWIFDGKAWIDGADGMEMVICVEAPSPTEAAIAAAELLGPPPAKRPPRNTRRTSIDKAELDELRRKAALWDKQQERDLQAMAIATRKP